MKGKDSFRTFLTAIAFFTIVGGWIYFSTLPFKDLWWLGGGCAAIGVTVLPKVIKDFWKMIFGGYHPYED